MYESMKNSFCRNYTIIVHNQNIKLILFNRAVVHVFRSIWNLKLSVELPCFAK